MVFKSVRIDELNICYVCIYIKLCKYKMMLRRIFIREKGIKLLRCLMNKMQILLRWINTADDNHIQDFISFLFFTIIGNVEKIVCFPFEKIKYCNLLRLKCNYTRLFIFMPSL